MIFGISAFNYLLSAEFQLKSEGTVGGLPSLVKDWLVKQHMKTLFCPSYSPDANLAEHLWNELERRLKKRLPKYRQQLGNLLMEEWNKTEISLSEKLVDSVANRVYECTRVKGSPTKY